MKICYLGDNGSVHNLKWIKAIAEQENVDLHVITFDRGVKLPNVNYHFLKSYTDSKADYILNIPRLKSIVNKIHPDIFHAHYASSYGYIASRCNFHPFIITGWGSDIFDSTKNPVLKRLIKNALSKADAITVLSKIALNEVKKLTNKSIELIPFGVDTDKFIPLPKDDHHRIRIGTIRTLSVKYGVEYLIRAFALIYQKYPNVTLEIVGDGELKEFLLNLSIELGVSDRVTFHGYINQQTEFEKYLSILSQLDIFAILSILDSETFGVACVEANACEIPVVASNVGGLTEVIVDGITGLIVEPKDPVATASALERLINKAELRIKMGKDGRRNVIENYNWKVSIEKMMQLYLRLSK